MELRGYIDLLRRRWWILLLGPVVAGISAFVLSDSITPTYQSVATLLVNQTQVPGVVQYNDVLTSERLTNTYAELVEREPIFEAVKSRLGLSIDGEQIGKKINVSTVRNTQLLRVTVRDHNPVLAANIANTAAQAFIDDNAAQLSRPGTVSIAEGAVVPGSPVSPNITVNTILAAFLGLAIAGAVVALQEYLDDTVKTSEDIEAIAGALTLGTVGRFSPKRSKSTPRPALSSIDVTESAEAYRQLRTNVHFARLAGELRTILVASANPQEGKSTSVANLAVVLAQAGQRVVAVDTDLRRPALHGIFRVSNSYGLTGLLLNEIDDPEVALLPSGVPNLMLLPSGPLPPNPSELLTSPAMERIVDALREKADYVIFDSPPLLAVTDASILAARTDGAILIAERGRTRMDALRRAHETLLRANARVLGVVINKAKRRDAGGYGRYSYYQAKPGGHERLQSSPRTHE
jgi:capsular exopolysaccharide synthesis family protein